MEPELEEQQRKLIEAMDRTGIVDERKRKMYWELYSGEEAMRVMTDESVDAMRRRIGVEVPETNPFNEVATKDAIRHFAQGIGDVNPLWHDEAYARKTRWGGITAPPNFVRNMGISKKKELTAEEREVGRGALSGIHAWYSGDDFYYYRPVRIGDTMTIRHYLADIVVKKSRFAGRTSLTTMRRVWVNQRNELVAVSNMQTIWGGREVKTAEGYQKRQKYADITQQHYTPEDIMRIDADRDKEIEGRRGSNPRYWEDVNEGEELIPAVVGPLSVTDIIHFCVGYGVTMYQGSDGWRYELRKRHPRGFPVNEFGVPDDVERVHWEDAEARRTGNPAAYDYGHQRLSWLPRVVTNWMGDDAWLYHSDGQWRRFVYIMDTLWIRGRVTRKYMDGLGQRKVDIEIHAIDQRGRDTAPGHATVILPSRVAGIPAVPPLDIPAPFKPEEVAV